MNKCLKTGLVLATVVITTATQSVMAIPTEVTDGITAQVTEVATYTGPAVVLALAVVSAGIAIKWTKKFINKAV